jgi:hypothetical protein
MLLTASHTLHRIVVKAGDIHSFMTEHLALQLDPTILPGRFGSVLVFDRFLNLTITHDSTSIQNCSTFLTNV